VLNWKHLPFSRVTFFMIIGESQLLIRTIIIRKQGPRGFQQKKLQN
jgi:hypothetical protein